jgi:hypothetical protein
MLFNGLGIRSASRMAQRVCPLSAPDFGSDIPCVDASARRAAIPKATLHRGLSPFELSLSLAAGPPVRLAVPQSGMWH